MSSSARIRAVKRAVELLLFSLIIGGINLFFQQNPGFFESAINPYIFLAFLVAAYYGKYFGFLSLFYSAIIVVIPFPFVANLIDPAPGWSFRGYVMGLPGVPFAFSLIGVYIFGIVRDSFTISRDTAKRRLRQVSRGKGILQRQIRSLQAVNNELEERISRQQDAVTSLYSHVQELYSLNLDKALVAVLEMTRKFSGATKTSLWEYQADGKKLRLAAQLGWDEDSATRTTIDAESSIEGWVVRNSMVFSVKLLLSFDNLKKMDTGNNLITLPVKAGNRVWGVLNIEEMPFVKYNLYTEKLLLMILSLSSPALERAIEYDTIVRQADIHPITHLPGFTDFYGLLQNELPRVYLEKGTLSVIILEICNLSEIMQTHGEEKAYTLMASMVDTLRNQSQNQARFFHYKADEQLVLVYPNLDFDGASQFCLGILSTVNSQSWEIDRQPVPVEMVLGYAALGEKEMEADEILEIAENLLEMQKV